MAAHQYWRLTGFLTDSNALELSQAQLYDGAQLIAQAPTFSVAPSTGTAFPDTLHWGDFSMPGFALTWNLATPVESPNLRLGAGSSALNFPKEFYCQYSDDGKFWSTNNVPTNVAFPGAGLMTAVPGSFTQAGDPDFSKVSLLLQDSLTDKSSKLKTVTVGGNAVVTTEQTLFGGSVFKFDGVGDWLSTTANMVDFTFGTGDFTLEMVVRPAPSQPEVILMDFYTSGTTNSWQLELVANKLYFYSSGATGVAGAIVLGTGVWTHIAASRVAGMLRLFVGGVLDVAVESPNDYQGAAAFSLGAQVNTRNGSYDYTGFMAGVRVTKGVGRYTAAFTPPTAAFPGTAPAAGEAVFIPLSETPQAKRWRLSAQKENRMAGSDLPAHNLREVTMETSFMDAYHGGIGRIYGTVAEKGTPNKMLNREVLLIDEASNVVIRKTWSDPVTGAYEFVGIRQGVRYTVLSYDYTQSFRAVVADNLLPELMQ